MEVLVPGLILVALMVYASTKIRKSAEKAFEPETIDTAEFHIGKPEGLLSPRSNQSPYVFEAYSKGFGLNGDANQRQITADIRVFDSSSPEALAAKIKKSAGKVLAERNDGGAIVIESQQPSSRVYFKIAASGRIVYRLRISVLNAYVDEFRSRIDQMLSSFRLK